MLFYVKEYLSKNKLHLFTLLFIFAVTFALAGYYSTLGTDPHHDGIMLKPAMDLASGKMLFRDSFDQYGALSTIIQAIALIIFGKYLIVIKLLTAFFYGLISVTAYLIWNKFLNKKLAFLSWVIWLPLAPYYIGTFLPWSSVYALFAQNVSLYFVILYLQKKQEKMIFLSGVFAGLTFWFKQNVGGYAVLGFVLCILILLIKRHINFRQIVNLLRLYILGGLLVSLPILIWLFANNAFVDWFKQSILFAKSWASESKLYPYQHFFPASFATISIWALAPILVAGVFLKEVLNKKGNLILVAICSFCLLSWLQYFPIPDIRHTYWAGTLYIGIMVFVFLKLAESIYNKDLRIKYLIFVCIFIVFFFNDARTGIIRAGIKFRQNYYSLENPSVLKGMKLTKSEYIFYKSTYDSIVGYENIFGKKYLITTGANALYLTFSNSFSFSPIFVDWPYIQRSKLYPDYWPKREIFIEKYKPLIIAVNKKIPKGYCSINGRINPEDQTILTVAC